MDKLNKINFWKRIEMFVSNVQVNDPMSEEEKEMIIRISKEYQNLNNQNPDAIGFAKWLDDQTIYVDESGNYTKSYEVLFEEYLKSKV